LAHATAAAAGGASIKHGGASLRAISDIRDIRAGMSALSVKSASAASGASSSAPPLASVVQVDEKAVTDAYGGEDNDDNVGGDDD
jgi:hypothetical protein